MITKEEYLSITREKRVYARTSEQFWWSEDYIIDNKLIRFSCVRKVNKQTLAMEDSDHVHYNDMGNYCNAA